MNQLFQPEGTVTFDSLCPLCKQPIRLHVPEEARNETTKAALDVMIRMTAHEECLRDRYRLERENKKAEVMIERQGRWETMCPPEYMKELDFSLENCKQSTFERLMAWQFNPRGILLHGHTSLCKTRMMFKLCEREHLAGRKVIALTHPEFRMQVSALASEDQRGLAKYMINLRETDIVFIDDLGKGNFTNATEEAFTELIDQRTRWHRPIFFTTNDDMQTLGRRLSQDRGNPILRRILDYCDQIAA